MIRRLQWLAMLAAWCAAAQTSAGPFGDTAEILKGLAEITGFRVLRPVKQETMGRDQLKKFFEERIKELVDPEDIRVEELVLKKFGLVPSDFDLRGSTIDLMTEQAAAFYDYRAKRMVLLDGNGGAMQQAALVHELAHALADQHFRLEKFLHKGGPSDDATMARTAVMEGQATWLMSEFMAGKMGRSLKDAPDLMEMMSKMSGGGGFPVFEKAPLYMRESLVFPYTKGMVFQHEVVLRSGKDGFAEVFRRPPGTTREVMHPEVYFSGFQATNPKVPAPAGGGWKELAEGTVGEFDLSILLQQYAFLELDAAKAWRGGQYRLWEHRKTKRAVLGFAMEFEGEAGATEFLRGYRKVLEKKWKQSRFTGEDAARLAGEGDDGHFSIRRVGAVVSGIEGLERPF